MHRLIGSLFVIAALAAGGTALAGPRPGPMVFRAIQQLDLTEEQREAIRDIVEEHREERRQMRHGRRDRLALFRDALLAEQPDVDELHRLVDEQHAEQLERAHRRVDDLVAISAVLTPEQKVELRERLEAMRREHREHHRAGPGHRY